MCYAASKLWNVCNYERQHYKETGMEQYPDWYYQKKAHKEDLWYKQLPSQTVKYLKGISGRKLFERFPEIRNQLWKGELWNHSYYVETVGSVSEENIRRYIEHQSKAY
ncbi:IS200/IS605 family transposase [Blautia wexlerae]|nr:IS200/IS605 family transposase [Blautia wexlerae]